MPFILSQFIEACRWIGGLVVLLAHTTSLFVNLGDIMSAPHSPLVYVWWFFSAFELGHQGVVGFFVMSGWLVGGAVLAHVRKQQYFLRDYLIHRFSRIYLVIVPATLLTAAFDALGRTFFADIGVYDWPLFKGHFSLSLFLGNLANLQSIALPYFGTNGPLWSLACEFWYYITFPLLLLPFARNYSPLWRYGGFALGFGLTIALAQPKSWFTFGYVLWALGALATLVPRPIIKSRWLALSIYAALVIVVRLTIRGPLLAEHRWLLNAADVLCSCVFLMVMIAFRYAPHEGFSLLRFKFHKTLADFSFSLYSIHLPMLVFFRAATAQVMTDAWPRELARLPHYLLSLVLMAVVFATAFVFARFTEARTGAARRALRQIFERIAPTPTEAQTGEPTSFRSRAPTN